MLEAIVLRADFLIAPVEFDKKSPNSMFFQFDNSINYLHIFC